MCAEAIYKEANRWRKQLRHGVGICADLSFGEISACPRQFCPVTVIDKLSASQETPVSLEALKDSLRGQWQS